MAVRSAALALLFAACFAVPARAQQADIDASKLPVNVERLQKKLQESVAREQRNGPTLRYTVEVFATAPRIELITPQDNLRFGPTPFSAPTHQEMMNIVTPQEFRAPAADFSNLFRWLKDRSKSQK
jgi:hypothetical protein